MTTMLVWVLVSISNSGVAGHVISYSPQMADVTSCVRMQKIVQDMSTNRTRCVQILVPKESK